jgi:hypothetical protein
LADWNLVRNETVGESGGEGPNRTWIDMGSRHSSVSIVIFYMLQDWGIRVQFPGEAEPSAWVILYDTLKGMAIFPYKMLLLTYQATRYRSRTI